MTTKFISDMGPKSALIAPRPLINFHRKIKHNEKVCHNYDLGSYAQGQDRDQVRGQNGVSAITQKLLKQI